MMSTQTHPFPKERWGARCCEHREKDPMGRGRCPGYQQRRPKFVDRVDRLTRTRSPNDSMWSTADEWPDDFWSGRGSANESRRSGDRPCVKWTSQDLWVRWKHRVERAARMDKLRDGPGGGEGERVEESNRVTTTTSSSSSSSLPSHLPTDHQTHTRNTKLHPKLTPNEFKNNTLPLTQYSGSCAFRMRCLFAHQRGKHVHNTSSSRWLVVNTGLASKSTNHTSPITEPR